MFPYLVAFVLFAPLIGIWMVEGGEFAGSIGVEGSPNGATLAFAAYALGTAVIATICARSRRRQVPLAAVPPDPAAGYRFRNFAACLLIMNLVFLLVFLYGFGASGVWLGDVGKGEFRDVLKQRLRGLG
jgi:hypothetical protein